MIILNMTNLGLVLIIIGWGIQLLGKGKNIKPNFVLVYSVGAVILAIDGYRSGLVTLAVLNLISFIVALAVFFRIQK